MDIFVEQIVKKKFGPKDYAIVAGVVLLGLIIVVLSMMFLYSIALIALILVGFGAYYIITSRSLEFEYSITNGDVTIDRIIYRRKRKRVISIDAKEIESMGRYRPEEHQGKNYALRIFASKADNGSGEDTWYFAARHSQKGFVLVVFNPEEKVLGAIKPFLPRQVAHDAFGRT